MKAKMFRLMAAGICAAGLLNLATPASATLTSGFGTIPGAGANVYSGSGIPQNTSVWTQASGLPGSDTLTLAEATTQHGSSNPAPLNDGVSTYNVLTGLSGGASKWNIDFYGNSAKSTLGNYTFKITILNELNGAVVSFDPSIIPDDVGGPSSFGNSERFDFAFIGLPIGYNANLNDTYKVKLEADQSGAEVAEADMTIIAGSGAPVPEPSTCIAGGLSLLAFVPSAVRRFRGKQATTA